MTKAIGVIPITYRTIYYEKLFSELMADITRIRKTVLGLYLFGIETPGIQLFWTAVS